MAETGGPVRIGVIGCAGRMGRSNLQEVLATPGAELAGGVERPNWRCFARSIR